uniref:TIL domain-containing protein n=1 Tax=Rhabditophanes sp. KR3021 TaxID=114890 RepID=A0AC35U5X4_9BILA
MYRCMNVLIIFVIFFFGLLGKAQEVEEDKDIVVGSEIGPCVNGFCPRAYSCFENNCFKMLKTPELMAIGPCIAGRCPHGFRCRNEANDCIPTEVALE